MEADTRVGWNRNNHSLLLLHRLVRKILGIVYTPHLQAPRAGKYSVGEAVHWTHSVGFDPSQNPCIFPESAKQRRTDRIITQPRWLQRLPRRIGGAIQRKDLAGMHLQV